MLKKLVAVVQKIKRMKKRKGGTKKADEQESNNAAKAAAPVKRRFTLSLDEAISDVTRSRDGDPLHTTGDTLDSNLDQLAASPGRHGDKPQLPFSADSVCGGRYSNEDAYCVVPNFITFPLHALVCPPSCPFLQHQQQQQTQPPAAGPPAAEAAAPAAAAAGGPPESGTGAKEVLHFFGVYDGHGGCAAAEYSAQRLHRHLREDALPQILQERGGSGQESSAAPAANGSWNSGSLEPAGQLHDGGSDASAPAAAAAETDMALGAAEGGGREGRPAGTGAAAEASAAAAGEAGAAPAAGPAAGQGVQESAEAGSPEAAAAVAAGDDNGGAGSAAAAAAAAAGGAAAANAQAASSQPAAARACTVEAAFTSAFLQTHKEFVACAKSTYVGTTAVVALVGESNIWVANCGDSRAVLCRQGQAIPLSSDHKPTRDDEAARVKAAGGHVLWERVMGELAVSRAIGDEFLRPYVIADPEVVHMPRTAEDELLLLATDGLWDVFTNQEACDVALKQLAKGWAEGVPHCRQAARHLIRDALMRSTRDNVTVVVVDLRLLKASVAGGLPGIGGCAEHCSVSH